MPDLTLTYDQFASFHDAHYANRDAEIDFYTSLIQRPAEGVLELGCGTGILLVGIAQHFASRQETAARLVGLDLSSAMLRLAKARAPGLGWIQADMTRPPVRGPFNLVFCAFNSLQMLETEAALRQTLARAAEKLGRGGRLAFDVYNAGCSEVDPTPALDRRDRLVGTFQDASGRTYDIREDALDEPDMESVMLDWRVRDLSTGAPTERARLIVRLRHYRPAVIDEAVKAAGLRVLARYGDVRRALFDSSSRKQVVVCGR